MQDATTLLSIPTIDAESDVLTAALAYSAAGWYVVPLARATKHPGSVLGNNWHSKSSRDPEVLASWFAGTDYGIALHVGRSGGVVLDIDDPEAVSATVRESIVQSGAPFQSTRPDVPLRGHAIFDANGVSYSNATGDIGSGLDVRGANGIIVVAPSEHGSGGHYEWLQTGVVPEVPEAIASRLRVSQDASDAATDAEVSAFRTRYTTEDSPGLLTPVLSRFEGDVSAGGSRHQAAVSCAAQVAREAVAGKYGAADGFDALESLFVESVTKGDAARCTVPAARSEFAGVVSWAVAQAKDRDPGELAAEIDARTRPELEPLPESGFWHRRPELRHIYTAAQARGGSAEAVLHACLARVSGMQNPQTTIDVGYGPIGLNYLACLVGPSGKGKSLALAIAGDLVSVPMELAGDRFADGVPPGSGEGIAEVFYGMIPEDPTDPKSKTSRGIARRNAYMEIDEGEALDRLGERSGSVLGTSIRSLFSCSTLGQQNATAERTRIVPRGSYSLGLVVGFQPGKMEKFFDEVTGGTPQRLAYADADPFDNRLPVRERPAWPGPLVESNERGLGWPAHRTSLVPWEASRNPREEQDECREWPEIDAHTPLIECRVAALLCVLSGEDRGVNDEDVELASMIIERSRAYRDRLYADHQGRGDDAAYSQGRLDGIRTLAMNETVERAATLSEDVRTELSRRASSGTLDGKTVRGLAETFKYGVGYRAARAAVEGNLPPGYTVEMVHGRGRSSPTVKYLG